MSDKRLQEIFKDKLESFEPKFKEKYWSDLDQKLSAESDPSIFGTYRWVWTGLILASVIGIALWFQQLRVEDMPDAATEINRKQKLPFQQLEEGGPNNPEPTASNEESTEFGDKFEINSSLNQVQAEKHGVHAEHFVEKEKSDQVDLEQKLLNEGLTDNSRPKRLIIPGSAEADLIVRLENDVDSADRFISPIFERNSFKWNKHVIVCDWTSSIYRFAADIVEWAETHQNNEKTRGFVFFTDCDSLGEPVSKTGRPGAMFEPSGLSPEELRKTMIEALRNSQNNKDWQENDLEAILYAQNNHPEVEEIILIADNANPVRDYKELVFDVKKPVRIIVCGNTEDKRVALQPDYWKLARKTGGSIHLIDQDLYNISRLKVGSIVRVDKYLYQYDYNRFTLIESRKFYEEKGLVFPF
jgi:hypothetical protein